MGGVEDLGNPGDFPSNSPQETRYRGVGVDEDVTLFSEELNELQECKDIGEAQRPPGKGNIMEEESCFLDSFPKSRILSSDFHSVPKGLKHPHEGEVEREDVGVNGSEEEDRVHVFHLSSMFSVELLMYSI